MPNLQHLPEELRKLEVDTAEFKLPAFLYDELVQQGEDIADEDDED